MKSRSLYRARTDHVTAAATAREERGTWLMAGLYASSMTAKLLAQQIPLGKKDAYTPAGEFEAYQAMHDDGYALWVRYVGGDEPVAELPDRMAVRVVNRGEGDGAGIVTVTVSTRCPRCGGPRGFSTVRSYRFPVNGVNVDADRWTNPCGHTDSHAAVLTESRERPLPVPVLQEPPEPPAPDSPAGVVLAAADGWRGMRAKAAVQVLDKHGFADEADRVNALLLTVKSRGHVSARQVAYWLHTGGAL